MAKGEVASASQEVSAALAEVKVSDPAAVVASEVLVASGVAPDSEVVVLAAATSVASKEADSKAADRAPVAAARVPVAAARV